MGPLRPASAAPGAGGPGLFHGQPEALDRESRRVSAFFREGKAAEVFPCLKGLGPRELRQKAHIVFFAHDLTQPGYPEGKTAVLFQYHQPDSRGFAGFQALAGWFVQENDG